MHSMDDHWENRTRALFLKNFGPAELDKRQNKSSQNSDSGWRVLMNLVEPDKAKKMVANCSRNILRRSHCVGAVGYAVVECDDRIPQNEFFVPGRRFRLRLRHSNVNCDDDAAACQREVAIKFADRNEDGPLDLILFTGRTALARSRKELEKVLKLTKTDDIRSHCLKDVNYYFALVDGLRRAPSSFAHLTYNSQMPYQFTATDGSENRAVRFRLVPGSASSSGILESGLLDDHDQNRPWETGRRTVEKRDPLYLRNEFIDRLRQDEPIRYILQMQMAPATDHAVWDSQKILDETFHPWMNVMKIELTTFLPSAALRQTYFNVVVKPKCLQFPKSASQCDHYSYQRFWMKVYTEFELTQRRQMSADDADDDGGGVKGQGRVRHDVTIHTKALKDGRRPPVDIYLTLAGSNGRSTPRLLTKTVCLSPKDEREVYEIEVEDVGELLAVIVAVKYRQLADDWFLQSVAVSDAHNKNVLHSFPCHSVVLSKTTLRRGDARLAHKQDYEIHRQERLLDLSEKQMTYTWLVGNAFPSQVKDRTVQTLPPQELQMATKYNGMLWLVDQLLIDFYRNFRQSMTTASRTTDAGGSVTTMGSSSSSVAHSLGSFPVGRQMSLGNGFEAADARHRNAMMRQLSVDITQVYEQDNYEGNAARARWKRVKHQVKVISESKIPEGSKGEMCREVQNDVEFARMFVGGINPTMIRQCNTIPDKFPVTDEMVGAFLDPRKNLEEEMADGRIYIVDYDLLDSAPPIHKEADHRYMAAPIVLLYVRANNDLVPLAIQLNQTPGPTNPIWTPNDKPEHWMLAKLWVRCADFHWGFGIAHYFRCHSLMEPFAVATMRHLSSAHPVYKLLKPHFRYTIATNTLMRSNLFKKDGLLDKYTSLGLSGFQWLVKRYWETRFSFDELDPLIDFRKRNVDDVRKLPNYFYRDDSVRLWTCVRRCCADVLDLFYDSPDDVRRDCEIHEWLRELNEIGFPGLSEMSEGVSEKTSVTGRRGLPLAFVDVSEIADLVSKVVFTLTCQHSATHSDAMDYLGFVPDIPAMMRLPPPDGTDYVVDRDVLTRILPDQYPDAYFGTLALVLNIHKPDTNNMCACDEIYFVEPEAKAIFAEFRKSMNQFTTTHRARNIIAGFPYENLMPSLIPTSPEPLPYVPRDTLRKALKGLGPHQCRDILFGNSSTSVPVMTLPLCRQFARYLGGRSSTGRRVTMTLVKNLRKPGAAGASVGGGGAGAKDRRSASVRAVEDIREEDDDDVFADGDRAPKKQPGRGSQLNSSRF